MTAVETAPPATLGEPVAAGSGGESDRMGGRPRPYGVPFVTGLWAAGALAALAVWFAVYAVALSAFTEHGRQARLYNQFRSQLAQETTVLGGAIPSGSPVALVSSPAAGIRNVVVVEGTTAMQLESGPGHLSDTPLPGQVGEAVLFGRSVAFGAPFAGLHRLRPGDRISVTTGQGVFVYRVGDLRRPGSPLPPTASATSSRLMLVTSEGDGWRQGWAPDHALFVDALLVHGQVQPVPAGLPSAVTPSAYAMRGDTGALVALVFWLQGLVLAAAAIAWGWARWGRWQTWVIGVPVVIALVWGATSTAFALLPNLI